jgi:hypothetical protein
MWNSDVKCAISRFDTDKTPPLMLSFEDFSAPPSMMQIRGHEDGSAHAEGRGGGVHTMCQDTSEIQGSEGLDYAKSKTKQYKGESSFSPVLKFNVFASTVIICGTHSLLLRHFLDMQ